MKPLLMPSLVSPTATFAGAPLKGGRLDQVFSRFRWHEIDQQFAKGDSVRHDALPL